MELTEAQLAIADDVIGTRKALRDKSRQLLELLDACDRASEHGSTGELGLAYFILRDAVHRLDKLVNYDHR